MNRKSILALLLLVGWAFGAVFVASAQTGSQAEEEVSNSQADEYYASLPSPRCDPVGGSVDLQIPVFTEAVQLNDAQLGPDTWVAWGLLVNGDAEVFIIRIASGDLTLVQDLAGSAAGGLSSNLKACIDVVPADHGSIGDPPSGGAAPPDLDLDQDGQPDPPDLDFDGDGNPDVIDDQKFEGTVLPGANVPLSFSPTDRIITFQPLGYVGTPFDPNADHEEAVSIAQELTQGLVANNEPVDNWVALLKEADKGFTSLVEELPSGLPTGSDYLLEFTFDPTLYSGYVDGWQTSGLSAYGSVAVSRGWVSGALYAKICGCWADYWSAYSYYANQSTWYLVQVVGQAAMSIYVFYGSFWYWIY